MRLAGKNYWFPGESQLEPCSAVNSDAAIDELIHIRRADFLPTWNNADVIRQVGKAPLDEALHTVVRIIPGFERMNLDEPLNVRRLDRLSDRVEDPLVK